ncbi:MAG: hypothetical protein HN366_02060 [Deltaproteobacteria bacterium]|nr:hypothetical protein [Deltaproteobacteria bacterium]
MENIFEMGCLIQLSTSVWGARRKIKTEQISDMASANEWLSTHKKLIDPCALKPIQKAANAARGYLAGVSLPFPINGMVFVPKEMISKVDEQLAVLKSDFNDQVTEFIDRYDRLRETAMVYLGNLFNETDYPVNIAGKFSFAWRFVALDVPNGKSGVLPPEVYEREKNKFVQTMEEARELAILSLREEFSGMINRITERFTNGHDSKPKVFKKGTINNFYEFFETFKERNIFRDSELTELVGRAEAILGGKSVEAIRSNDQLKQQIRNGMAEVETSMEDILSRPRRRIVMD